MNEFNKSKQLTWCDGCGNYGIMTALRFALNECSLSESNTLLCFDIGCNGNMSDKLEGYKVHTLHGRVLPIATGAKLAETNLNVVALAGDGATYAEGIGHFIHSIRNNYPIIFLVHDNSNYGLTTGQCSPTSNWETYTNGNAHGNSGKVFNPLEVALSVGSEFVAQGFSGDIFCLKEIIKSAIHNTLQTNTFSFVNILQTCPTYNKTDTDGKYFNSTINYTSSSYSHKSELLQNDSHDESNFESSMKLARKYKEFAGVLYNKSEKIPFLNKVNYTKIEVNRNQNILISDLF